MKWISRRILIPSNLRNMRLTKDIVVIGVSTRVEIWDRTNGTNTTVMIT